MRELTVEHVRGVNYRVSRSEAGAVFATEAMDFEPIAQGELRPSRGWGKLYGSSYGAPIAGIFPYRRRSGHAYLGFESQPAAEGGGGALMRGAQNELAYALAALVELLSWDVDRRTTAEMDLGQKAWFLLRLRNGALLAGTDEPKLHLWDGRNWTEVKSDSAGDFMYAMEFPSGAIVVSFAADGPADPYRYRSTDGGLTWTKQASPIAAGPYVGLGGTVALCVEGSTVYRSANDGLTWTSYGALNNGDAQDLLFWPNGRVYAACGDSWAGVEYSDDGGVNWTACTALTDLGAYAYAIERAQSRLVVAGEHSGDVVVWTSDNLGTTWTKRTVMSSSGTETTRALARSQNGVLLVISHDAAGEGVWQSVDRGATWTAVRTSLGQAVEQGPWR